MLNAIGYCLNGPAEFLPDSLILMAIGNLLTGYAMCYQSCLSLAEMTKRAKELCPDEKERCGDYCAAIFNTSLGIGQTVGPIYGAYFTEIVGFQGTQDIVSFLCLVLAVLYFFICDGKDAFKTFFQHPLCTRTKGSKALLDDSIQELQNDDEHTIKLNNLLK